jgi:muramoyltetrapeptide carboxypeptidase
MPALLKPPALRPGSHLAILSPASTPKASRVHDGIKALHELGYKTTLYPNALNKGPLYFAGTATERLNDLLSAFADPAIDAIICTRGGWGSAELLPKLNLDLIRDNPKPFLGYSDHTSLHAYLLESLGLVTFYAPMVAADFARPNGFDPASWTHALTGTNRWSFNQADGLRVLREGVASGQLRGGCISIYAQSLGTRYAPSAPDHPTILFLEDIGTKPYQWDRYLLHLRYAGHLEYARGIVFGDMSQNVPPEEEPFLEQAILHNLRDFTGPIAIGLRSGHVDAPNITLPLGIEAELDTSIPSAPRLTYLESAVLP